MSKHWTDKWQTTKAATELVIGETYFFQTANKDWRGRLHSIQGPYTVVLTEAAWVANSGRLHEFMRDGKAEGMEVEPVGTVCVQWVNWMWWPHKLFKEAQ